MKALILAGGLGTRLRPLTLTRPKHMLPVANVPHIEHVFHLLHGHGIDEVVLLTSYMADAFAEVIGRAAGRGMAVVTTLEDEPLGTAGALKNAESLVGKETFIVFNGDILTDLDVTTVLEWHRARRAEATIVLHAVEDPSAFGVVPTDAEGRVLGFVEKPAPDQITTNLINAGVYVFEPSVLKRIPAGRVCSAERELFPQLVGEGARLYALATDAYWMDIGTPDKYRQANLDALVGRYSAPWFRVARDQTVVAADVAVDSGARVKASCVGPGCVVGSGARIEESVLLAGTRVEPDAAVIRSVVGSGAVIASDAVVEDAAIGDDEVIPAASHA